MEPKPQKVMASDAAASATGSLLSGDCAIAAMAKIQIAL